MSQEADGVAANMNQPPASTEKVIAGFWIRVIADGIDMAILWGIAWVLGTFMEGWFLKLGENGVWVGLLVSIAYFVPMQSRYGNGQSLGKRLLGIQVLDRGGQPLSVAKSFIRYGVVAFVAYASIFMGVIKVLRGSSLAIFAGSILGTVWFVALLGCYFLLPLHPLKRGLHDLIAGSVVVHRGRFSATALAARENPAKTKRAYAIVGVISALAIIGGVWGFLGISKSSAFKELQEIQNKLESTGNFRQTSVMDGTFRNDSGTTRSIIVQAHVKGSFEQSREDLKPAYDLAFQAIRDQVKDLSHYDNLRVGLRLGYDLGIRKRYLTLFQDESPSKPGERKDSGSNSNF